ncbi:MAG: RluA family pseudouridine synthase [Bacteroidales bacterium]|nr:RluA family pseudouridine synthase [Bacteroidales bacterium]
MQIEEKDEFVEHYKFTVDRGQELMRMDKYLLNLIQNTSRNKIQNAAKAGCILVNGMPEKQNYRVKPGDYISILMPNPPRDVEIIPENIPLKIVFEDDDIIIINKDAGLVVHPAYGNYTGTLVNALTYLFQDKKNKNGDLLRPLLVHRIDKNTSGIMVIAKNEEAQMTIAREFYNHSIDRKYWALVWGDFEENEGTISAKVGRNLKDRLIMTTFSPESEHGKHAVTHWKVLERFGYVTLIECQLETGRTHQIRVHLKSIGHPLFNDETYGGDQIIKGTTFTKYKQFVKNCFELIPRQALHAKQLGLKHPITGKEIFFDSDLPADFNAVLEKWRHYVKYKEHEDL